MTKQNAVINCPVWQVRGEGCDQECPGVCCYKPPLDSRYYRPDGADVTHDSHQEQVMLLLLLSRDTQQPQQQQGLPDTWTQTTKVSTVILNNNNIDNR